MTAPDTRIAVAICNTIRDLDPPVTPQSTITNSGGTAPGATSFTLADASRFTGKGRFWINDQTAERRLSIATVSGNVVTPSFAGLPSSGLQFAHAQGVTVTTNLFPGRPRLSTVGPMLAKGDPCIFVWVLKRTTPGVLTFGEVVPCYVAHLQYHRLISQADEANPMDPGVYADDVEQRAREDMHRVWQALAANPKLNADDGVCATGFEVGSADFTDEMWDHVAMKDGTVQFVCPLDLRYTGLPEQLGD